MPEQKKHGFISPDFLATDYFRGVNSKLTGESLVDDGDWRKFRPLAEHQAPANLGETNGCTYFGTWEALEMWWKFIFGTEMNQSDRFSIALALSLGMFDPAKGGTPKDAIDNIRKNWSVREDEYPTVAAANLQEFYTKPSATLQQIAKSRLEEIGHVIGYEYIPNPTVPKIREALKSGTVCFSNALMPTGDGRYYKPDGWRDSHWMAALAVEDDNLIGGDSYFDFDGKYEKAIRGDFIPEVAMKYEMNKELAWSLKRLIEELNKLLQNVFVSPDLPISTPKKNYIHLWATAIRDFESGGNPNSLSMKLNNPGAIKGRDGNFLKFNSYIEGFAYLQEYLKRAATGKHAAYKPTFTMKDFINVYAPSSENSSASMNNYATHIIKRLDITETTQIGTLV